MPQELEDIKDSILDDNPGMDESKAWAIATKTFKKRHGIKGKTTEKEMQRKASSLILDKTAFWRGFQEELKKIAKTKGQPFRMATETRDSRKNLNEYEPIQSKSVQDAKMDRPPLDIVRTSK